MMSVDDFAKQFRWGTDPKTIKALEKMRTRELKERANKIAQDAIKKNKGTTMSDMKCPFCQQELEKRHAATTDYNSMFITYYCGNPECESTTDLIGCKEFWDILGQLIRTRKALDVAVDKLKGIKAYYDDSYADPNFVNWHIVAQRLANDADDAIKAITALEQKDGK